MSTASLDGQVLAFFPQIVIKEARRREVLFDDNSAVADVMTRLPIARVPLAVHASVASAVGALPKKERTAFWQSIFRQSLEQPTVATLVRNISSRAKGERTLKFAIRSVCHVYRLIHVGFTKCSVEQLDAETLRFRVDEFPSHALSLEHYCEALVVMFREIETLCHGKLDITVNHGPSGTSAWLDLVVT